MRSTRAAPADRKGRNAVTSRRTCGQEGPQCGQLAPHARTGSAAMGSACAARADMTAAMRSPRCAGARAYCGSVTTRTLPAVPLTSRLNRLISPATKSKIVRPPILAAVGGTGVLDKHIRPVPARELSFLLLPRALEVCTRLGQSSTGRAGAWPGLPAGGRSHLSTSRDVASGLISSYEEPSHEYYRQ